MEDPFRSIGGIIELFENHIEERTKLIMKINEIRDNTLEII
jgi:type I restriction enzyme R subunit